MARQITETQEAVLTEAETQVGTAFVKNHLNEIIVLPNGNTYQFKKTREVITDPELVKGLKKVAGKYGIIVAE